MSKRKHQGSKGGQYQEGGGDIHPPPPLAGTVTSYVKTTVHCFPDSSVSKKGSRKEVKIRRRGGGGVLKLIMRKCQITNHVFKYCGA